MTAELKINEQLPVLAFNFDQLKAWATELAGRYANLVVTEDAIADVKRDMAELNKAKKAVDDARKEAVRRVSEPIRAFESQIKEVCGIFDSAYAKLGNQVKAFEDAQREEKRAAVHEIIAKAVLESGYGLTIPVQDKWLNKTASLKSIREDVAAIINRHMEEEQRKAALEQARQDRAAAIESHVVNLNNLHGFSFPVARFFAGRNLDLSVPLEVVLGGITAFVEQEKAKELKKRESSCGSQNEHKADCVSKTAKNEPQAAPAQTRAMSIVFEFDVANEVRVKACLENLKPLCVHFGARYRQE